MIPEVLITSCEMAARVLASPEHTPRYLISIGEAETETPRGFRSFEARRRLRLEFDDIEHENPKFWYVGITAEQVAELLAICRKIARKPAPVLVHCAVGARRSTACALALFAVCLGPGLEEPAVQALLAAREWSKARGVRDIDDWIQPNRRIVYMVDQALDRKGALLAAVEAQFKLFNYREKFDIASVT